MTEHPSLALQASVCAVLLALIASSLAYACPFCSVTSQTLSEEMAAANVVVLTRYVGEGDPPQTIDDTKPTLGTVAANTSVFEITEIIKGDGKLQVGDKLETIFFGKPQKDEAFLVTGIGLEKVDWMTPLPLTPAAIEYVRQLPKLSAVGADRLVFFQDYLECDDPMLDQDAYDEFARAPYSELHDLKDRMDHAQLLAWIEDPEVNPSRRRLYLTMLGVCGSEDDLPLLERMLLSDIRISKPIAESLVSAAIAAGGGIGLPIIVELVELDQHRQKLGMDALVACYVTLGGPDRLDVIDQRFLIDPEVEYTYIYSTLMALRFHDMESDVVPRERLLQSMRLLLVNPDFADQVIIDLARLQDWTVLDRLVTMFKEADENSFVPQPVVSYLMEASKQEGDVGRHAEASLAELERLDPDTVARARSLAAFGALGRTRPAGDPGNAARPQVTESTTENNTEEGEFEGGEPPDPTSPEFQMSTSPNPSKVTPKAAVEEASDTSAANDSNTSEEAVKMPLGSDGLTPPNGIAMVGIPLLAATLLAGLYWLILRGSGT